MDFYQRDSIHGVVVQYIGLSPIAQESGVRFHAGDKCSITIGGQKAIEAELGWVDCGTTRGHFMNHKRRTAEKKDARQLPHKYECVYEIKLHL